MSAAHSWDEVSDQPIDSTTNAHDEKIHNWKECRKIKSKSRVRCNHQQWLALAKETNKSTIGGQVTQLLVFTLSYMNFVSWIFISISFMTWEYKPQKKSAILNPSNEFIDSNLEEQSWRLTGAKLRQKDKK